MKPAKQAKKALRTARKAVAPAVELTRNAAREVFKKVKAAHKASTKAVKKGLAS